MDYKTWNELGYNHAEGCSNYTDWDAEDLATGAAEKCAQESFVEYASNPNYEIENTTSDDEDDYIAGWMTYVCERVDKKAALIAAGAK